MGAPKKSRDEWLAENGHLPKPLRRPGAIQAAMDGLGLAARPTTLIDEFLRRMACHGYVLTPVRSTMSWSPDDLEAAMARPRSQEAA